jgi:D-sedoheptulose 7-phosphate isomerase
MRQRILHLIDEHFLLKKTLVDNVQQIERAAELIVRSYRSHGKVLVFGNGGSAADAQHFAAELVGRFKRERQALAAIALTTDTSILTAMANDYGFDRVFARQVEALAMPGDVVIGITTSGNSPNVLQAVESAKQIGTATMVLNGRDGGKLKGKADVEVIVASKDTARIQEAHILCIHIICELVEEVLSHDKSN